MRAFVFIGLLFFTTNLFGMKTQEDNIKDVAVRPDQKLIAMIINNKIIFCDRNDKEVASFKTEPDYIFDKIHWCKDFDKTMQPTGQAEELRQYASADKSEFTLIATLKKKEPIPINE